MDLRPSFSAVLAAFGVDATVTVPSGSPVATRVVWMPPLSLDYPPTGELRRLEAKRVLHHVLKAQNMSAPETGTEQTFIIFIISMNFLLITLL